jgi:hypothetical protein
VSPDITMCQRTDCPSRDKCWRHTAQPNALGQSFFAPPYLPIVDGKCEQFISDRFREERDK